MKKFLLYAFAVVACMISCHAELDSIGVAINTKNGATKVSIFTDINSLKHSNISLAQAKSIFSNYHNSPHGSATLIGIIIDDSTNLSDCIPLLDVISKSGLDFAFMERNADSNFSRIYKNIKDTIEQGAAANP